MKKSFTLVFVLFACAIGIDLYHLLLSGITSFPPLSKELLWFGALILILWIPFHEKLFAKLDLFHKLRIIVGLQLIIGAGYKFYSYFQQPVDESVFGLNDVISGFLLPLIAVGLALWIFLIYKSLIFVQQGKNTEFYFRLLIFLIAVHIVYNLIYMSDLYYEYGEPFTDFEAWGSFKIFESLIISLALMNGTRCKWIHYLKKFQKVGVFFVGAITFGLSVVSISHLSDLTRGFSQVVTVFLKDFFLFYCVYSGMSLLCALIQLPSAGLLDRRREELNSLQNLSATIRSVFDKKELIHKSTSLCLEMINADLSWMDLYDKRLIGHFVGMKGQFVPDMLELGEDDRKSLRDTVLKAASCCLWNNMKKDQKGIGIKKWPKRSGSLLAAPLKDKDHTFGVLYGYREENYGFSEESRGVLQSFADQVAVALSNVNLVALTVEQELYKEELRVAHEAQMRLIPKKMPEIPGADINGFCLTANDIGGDFYDVIPIGPDRVDIIIGDVSGKGASAAFYMAELKGMIQMLAPNFTSPKKILTEMNRYLYTHFESQTFVTVVYAVYTPSKKQAVLARAGHTPVGLFGNGQVKWLEMPGLGLGLVPNNMFEAQLVEKKVTLKKNEGLFFYTDGLVEARNQQGDEFGEDALTELIENMETDSVQQILDVVRHQVQAFSDGVPRIDDITLVVLCSKEI